MYWEVIRLHLHEENIKHVTDSGKKFIYPLFSENTIEIAFRVGYYELLLSDDSFLAFHQSVNGESTPFYFSLLADHSDSILVRKEAGFDPAELNSTGQTYPIISATDNGNETVFDYVLRMTEEL